jgi:hypothetical protein
VRRALTVAPRCSDEVRSPGFVVQFGVSGDPATSQKWHSTPLQVRLWVRMSRLEREPLGCRLSWGVATRHSERQTF